MKKLVNNQVVDMTAEDLTRLENENAVAQQHIKAKEDIQKANMELKESGNLKLLSIMTQAEATALTGFVPIAVEYQNLIDAGKTPEEATTLTGYTPE